MDLPFQVKGMTALTGILTLIFCDTAALGSLLVLHLGLEHKYANRASFISLLEVCQCDLIPRMLKKNGKTHWRSLLW